MLSLFWQILLFKLLYSHGIIINVAQYKLKRTSRTHTHTKKTVSTTATTNKQRARHYQIMHSYMLILTKTLTSHISVEARILECFHTNKCMHRKTCCFTFRPIYTQTYVQTQTSIHICGKLGQLVGKSARLMIERLRVWIPAGAAGKFSSPELTLCADTY